MADLVMAPYLPLREAVLIGDWRLTPFGDLDELLKAMPSSLRQATVRLIEAYTQDEMGAVVHPDGSGLGADYEHSEMRQLSHAVLAGAVGANPAMAEPDNSNSGWRVQTSENAILLGHRLENSNSYSIQQGMLARLLQIQAAEDGEPLPKVTPPAELPRPMVGSFDEELAQATFSVLQADGLHGRQLHRAMDWYRVALSNADAVPLDVRVGAARSALEVLTGSGEETKRLVRAYGALVREEDEAEKTYGEADAFWAKGSVQLTADEWWVTRLCELRNAIMHGDEVADELWQHESHHQLNHIHDNLQKALRARLSEAVDDPLLRLSARDRIFPRIYQRLEEDDQTFSG